MADTLYTTTEKIRAALGVSAKELSDEIMTGLQLDIQLEVELDVIVPTHDAIKTAGTAGGASAAQIKAWKQLQVLTQYVGALILDDNRQMWSAQKVSDGDFDMQRFSSDDLTTLRNNLIERRNFFLAPLNPELVTTASLLHLTRVTPSYDPVIDV